MSDEHFLSRWSRRKSASTAGPAGPTADAVPAQAGTQFPQPTAGVVPTQVGTQSPKPDAPAPLPPIESLTPESDFSPFMQADVAEHLKRRALKTLFQDPRFNVMDGLDVYIDDYSKPDPLPEGWLEKLNQVARLGEYRAPEEETAERPEGTEATPAAGSAEIAAVEEPLGGPPAVDSSDTAAQPSPPAPVKES